MSRSRRLLSMEWTKLRHRRMTWSLIAGLLAICALMPWGFLLSVEYGSGDSPKSATLGSDLAARIEFPGALQSALDNVLAFGLPVVIILAANAFGGEFAWGTLRLLMIRGEGRREYVGSKLATLFILWLGALSVAIVVGLVTVAIIAQVSGRPGLSAVTVSDIPPFAGHVLASIAGGWIYISFTAFITLQKHSTASGVGWGLFMFFGDRVASASALASSLYPLEILGKSGINYNLRSLTGGAGDDANPLMIAAIAIGLYLIATIVGSLKRLDRQDITVSGVG